MGGAVSQRRPIEETSTKGWFNLKGDRFEELPDRWYNLTTSRYVKNKPNLRKGPVLSLRGIRVLGTAEDLATFWKANLDILGQTLPKRTKFEDVVFNPFEDISFLSEDASLRSQKCFLGAAGTLIPLARTHDVADLPQETIEKICRFSFAGLFTKGRVTQVIDGDTLDVIIFVPLTMLGAARNVGKDAPQVTVLPTQGCKKAGFFTQVRIRMYGYDSAEKNTEAGVLAKKLFEEKIQSLNNIVWCQFVETVIASEKYGRFLAVLYEDKERTRLLNDYLLKQESAVGVSMVHSYLGGTKQKFDL